MNSSFFKLSSLLVFISISFIVLCFSSTISILSTNNEIIVSNGTIILPENVILNFSNSKFLWPTPGYNIITSYFGYRFAPTAGASTYHSGIDIAAAEGTNILAIFSGTVTYVGFSGAGGYTISVKSGNFTASYCHVNPNFLVSVGEYVLRRLSNCESWS